MNFIPFAKQAISLLLYITNSSSGSPGSPGAPEPQTMNCNFACVFSLFFSLSVKFRYYFWGKNSTKAKARICEGLKREEERGAGVVGVRLRGWESERTCFGMKSRRPHLDCLAPSEPHCTQQPKLH